MNSNLILTIVGPTGVGKTAYAIELAQAYGAELISADSRQVYIGMDIGTGKEVDQGDWVMINERKALAVEGVLIHGLDCVEPDQDFSVADWSKRANLLIDEIVDRGKYPIIVGGTGFYLDALQGRIETLHIGPNQQLRAELVNNTVPELQQRLSKIAPQRWEAMNDSDRQNPARLIRALEITEAKAHIQDPKLDETELSQRELSMLGLTMDRAILLEKVDRRIRAMVEQGLIEETRQLIEHYGDQSQAMTSIGYQEMSGYLAGRLKLDQAIQLMQQRTHDYIKRQYTWFAKQSVVWVEVDQPDWRSQADLIAQVVLTE